MNILMVGPDSSSKGGVATVIANFKKYYKVNQVYYLSTWTEKNKRLSGIQAALKIRSYIKKYQIEIVHFHVAQRGSYFRKAFLAKLVPKQCKVIFHMHASQFDTFYQNSSKWVKKRIISQLNQLDALVALSEEWKAFYEQLVTIPIWIIENAVRIPDKPTYNTNATEIVTFGRIGKRKGSYDILEVAKRIEPIFPDIKFVLYGDGELSEVERQITVEGISNVCLGGWINNEMKAQILKKTTLHLLPSYQEGLPMAILETMAEGIPNLASNVGGIPQVLKDGENGFMITPGNITEIVEKLTMFLTSIELRKKMSEASFEKIKEKFSIEVYFEKWDMLYHNLLSKKSNRRSYYD